MRRRIEISLTAADPPAGTAERIESIESRPFVGWLDLLRVLADLVGEDEHPDEAA